MIENKRDGRASARLLMALGIIAFLELALTRVAWAQKVEANDSCERLQSQPVPKFRFARKNKLGLKPGLVLYVSISLSDRYRDKLIAVSCQLGRKYATEESLFVWILDSNRAAKRYNPQGEGNDRETNSVYVGLYAFVREDGAGNQALDWRSDPSNRDRLDHIDLGPPPDKLSQ
jgi:hypothetical protein